MGQDQSTVQEPPPLEIKKKKTAAPAKAKQSFIFQFSDSEDSEVPAIHHSRLQQQRPQQDKSIANLLYSPKSVDSLVVVRRPTNSEGKSIVSPDTRPKERTDERADLEGPQSLWAMCCGATRTGNYEPPDRDTIGILLEEESMKQLDSTQRSTRKKSTRQKSLRLDMQKLHAHAQDLVSTGDDLYELKDERPGYQLPHETHIRFVSPASPADSRRLTESEGPGLAIQAAGESKGLRAEREKRELLGLRVQQGHPLQHALPRLQIRVLLRPALHHRASH